MSEQNFKAQNESNTILQYIQKFTPYWPIFVLTVLMSLAIAYVYLRAQPIVYQAYGKILIKDPVKNGSDSKVLDEFNIIGEKKSVENEILVLRSVNLMKEVVSRLNLNVTVFNEGRVRTEELYKENSPVFFQTVDTNQSVNGAGKYYFTVDWQNSQVLIDNKKVAFNTLLKIGGTSYLITPNPVYNKGVLGKNYFVNFNSIEGEAGNLASAVWANPVSSTSSVVDVKLSTTVPPKGIDVLNALFQVYNEYAIRDKNRTAENTIKFINNRLGLVAAQVDSVQRSYEKFRVANNVFDIGVQSQAYLGQTTVLDQENSQLDLKLDVLNNVSRYVSSKNGKSGMAPSLVGIEDPILGNLLTNLSMAEDNLEKAKAVNGDQSNVVLVAEQEVNKLRSSLNESILNIRQNLLSSKESNNRLIGKNSSMLRNIPNKEREFVDISREKEIKNSIYIFLLQKREEAALNSASTISDLTILESANAYGPISPIPKTFYMTGLIIGLMVPAAFVLLKDLLNRRVMFRHEIEQKTSVPVVGEIAQVNTSDSPVVIGEGKRTVIAEQFRTLRTNLTFMGLGEKSNVLMVTSSVSGEGKSFTAINLAVSFSLMGKKVALLEMDLRKPKISKLLGLQNDIGISNYLVNQCTLDEIIKETEIKDLFVVSSGIVPPNPAELIMRDKFRIMIEELKKRYDYVIIDTAPVGPVSDAFLLKQYADATIFMVRHNGSLKVHLKLIEDLKRQGKLPNMCIVFNGLRKRGFAYGGSGYGSYGGTAYGGGYYVNDSKSGEVKNLGSKLKKTLGI